MALTVLATTNLPIRAAVLINAAIRAEPAIDVISDNTAITTWLRAHLA